jgi:ubiquinone biosynthesis UbiH/UbiF/VisC/COQ6 family hydroxylase
LPGFLRPIKLERMATQFDIIVVGGGLVGASLALSLEPHGYSVALIESHAAPPLPGVDAWDSRIYSITPGSAALLQSCGAWDSLPQERITRVEAMQIYGDDVSASLRFSAYDAGLRELAYIAENSVIHHALWERLRESTAIRVYSPARCAAIAWEERSVTLELDSGDALSADLIVGADGADSWVREEAGIHSMRQPYGEIGVVANFAAMRPHHGAAYQWFGRQGVLALLPLPGDRVSMVWSTPEAHADELMRMSANDLADAVADASGYALGSLDLITPAAGFPLRVQRVSSLVGPHVALVGDAAHNVHPLAGQGVNLGFRDVRELAGVLAAPGGHTNCGDYFLLRRYERARAEDIATMRAVTDGLQKLFRADMVWLARLRNMGLSMVGRMPPVKNLLIRHAIA